MRRQNIVNMLYWRRFVGKEIWPLQNMSEEN